MKLSINISVDHNLMMYPQENFALQENLFLSGSGIK